MARKWVLPVWDEAQSPEPLLELVWPVPPQAFVSEPNLRMRLPENFIRRARLFGVGCAKMCWEWLSTDARSALRISERYAEGQAASADLQAASVLIQWAPITFTQRAQNAAGWASDGCYTREPVTLLPLTLWNPIRAAEEAAKACASHAAGPAPPSGNPVAVSWQRKWDKAFAEAKAHQAELVRDLYPPPGHAPQIAPEWRTATVIALAEQMHITGDFSAVPILADALQEAGCEDEIILDRCRAPSQVHCRGNWVVDLVLGRA